MRKQWGARNENQGIINTRTTPKENLSFKIYQIEVYPTSSVSQLVDEYSEYFVTLTVTVH